MATVISDFRALDVEIRKAQEILAQLEEQVMLYRILQGLWQECANELHSSGRAGW